MFYQFGKSFLLQIELQTAQEKVRHVLCNEWDQLVRIESPAQPDKTDLKRIVVGLEDGQAVIKNLVQAMHASDTLYYRWQMLKLL